MTVLHPSTRWIPLFYNEDSNLIPELHREAGEKHGLSLIHIELQKLGKRIEHVQRPVGSDGTAILFEIGKNFFYDYCKDNGYDYALIFVVTGGDKIQMWQIKPSLATPLSADFGSFEAVYEEINKRIEKAELQLLTQRERVLQKSLEFSPEHKQAGLQILNYFQETLNQKYPDNEVTVRIGQKGNLVTMEIETPDGNTEKYEEALEDYGLVLTGKKDVADYLEDKADQINLKHQLQMAKMQMEHQKEMLQIKSENLATRDHVIRNQEATIESLNLRLEKFTTSYTHLAERLADIANTSTNQAPVEHFKLLDAVLSVKGEAALTAELDGIKEDNPDLHSWLQTQAKDIVNKTIVGTASKLLIEFFKRYFG